MSRQFAADSKPCNFCGRLSTQANAVIHTKCFPAPNDAPNSPKKQAADLRPDGVSELQDLLRDATAPISGVDIRSLCSLKTHVPEDMTATVDAGMTLADFQATIGKRDQWLPVDPPAPELITIGELLADNLSGPRRMGFGVIRDWLIGLRYVSAEGDVVFNGGNVVKNVAGFDLCKLMVGNRNALGIIVEATFKLAPKPELEQFFEKSCSTITDVADQINRLWNSGLQFSVLDLKKPRFHTKNHCRFQWNRGGC